MRSYYRFRLALAHKRLARCLERLRPGALDHPEVDDFDAITAWSAASLAVAGWLLKLKAR